MAITAAPPTTASGARRWWSAFVGAWQADWRERRRDWRVAAVMALATALALTAALVVARSVTDTLEARAFAGQAETSRWLHQGKKYPHSAAHYGVYVFKPLSALSAFDPGVERFVGSSVWLEAHKQNDFVQRPANGQPGMTRHTLTPAFVLQVLAPLAIVFLGFGAFAREREQGTMGSLRLSGASIGAIAAARAAVLLLLGLALALPACAAVIAVQWLLAAGNPFVDAGPRAALLAAGTVIHLATWSALVVAVSAASRTTRSSLAVLLGLWIATAIVVPRLAVEWSAAAAPLPSMQAFRQALDADLSEPDDPDAQRRDKQALLERYGVTDSKDLPVNWAGITLQKGEEHGNVVFDRHYGALFAALQRQSDAAAWAGFASPTLALAGLSAAAAGSDAAHHVQFIRAAEAQRRTIQRTMNDAITATPEREGPRKEADETLWSRVPPFVFRFAPLSTADSAQRLAPLVTALLASLVCCGVAIGRLGRGALR